MSTPSSRIPRYYWPSSSSQARSQSQGFYTRSLESTESSSGEEGTNSNQAPAQTLQEQLSKEGTYVESFDRIKQEPLDQPQEPLDQATPVRQPEEPLGQATLPGKQAKSVTMDGILEAIPYFDGRKDGAEDPVEHLETINFVVDEKYPTDPTKCLTVKRMAFRMRVKHDAQKWYASLDAETRADWDRLSASFLEEYKSEPKVDTHFFSLLYNLKQNKKPIGQYVKDADKLYRKCPEKFREMFGSQFIAGLAEDSKLDMVQLYLSTETKLTFQIAKAAVIKAYSRIGRASPFDLPDKDEDEVTQSQVNTEMMNFFKGLTMAGKQPAPKTVVHEHHEHLPAPPSYKSRMTAPLDIICHNCLDPGHYSSDCPLPQVGFKQKGINRLKAEEIQRNADPPKQAPAATIQAAALQWYQSSVQDESEQHPKVRGPLQNISGNAGRAQIHSPKLIAPVVLKRGQSLDELPTSSTNQHRYPVAAAAKPGGSGGQNSSKTPQAPPNIANRVHKPVKQKEQPSQAAKQAIDLLSKPPQPTGHVEEMEIDDSQGVSQAPRQSRSPIRPTSRDVSPISERAPSPETITEGPRISQSFHTQPRERPPRVTQVIEPTQPQSQPQPQPHTPSEPQRRINISNPKQTEYSTKETVPINVARDRSRFQIESFMDSPVTLSFWQLLDRSPQLRAQLARAMASSKPSRRGKRPVVAVASKKEKGPPTVLTQAHEEGEEEVKCLYIEAWAGDYKIPKTLADNGAVVELINPALVEKLGLEVYSMEETWTLQLANDGLATVKQYVWIPVNVAGVEAYVRAFILGLGSIYDLLLSKRWMKRVKAIEDHGESTLIIKGTDSVSRVAYGKPADPLEIELLQDTSVDAWETGLAEDELARLAEELDGYDFAADQGKDLRC